MEYRRLGNSGFQVPALCYGALTFGGGNEFFKGFGSSDLKESRKMVDICLEAGVNLFDTADAYSGGLSEELLGKSLKGRRNQALISTKASFRMGPGTNDLGNTRFHLIEACEASLRRLGTDHIDIYHMHGYDALTPPEETLGALDTLVKSGKVRYIGCSNFSGWHLMKSLMISEKYGLARYTVHQAYYSAIGRDYEWELMPLALEHGVGTMVWSPLGWGRLTGKIRRGQPLHKTSRLHVTKEKSPPVADETIYKMIDVMDEIALETGKSISQIALNWLLQRPTISTVIVGARNAEQLKQNLGAVGWNLTAAQVEKIDRVGAVVPPYPYWHQQGTSAARNPLPVPRYW